MNMIVNYWWFWLVGMLVFYGIGLVIQLKIEKSFADMSVMDKSEESLQSSLGAWLVSRLLGHIFALVLVISTVGNIIVWAYGYKLDT